MMLYPDSFPVALVQLEETDSTNRYLTQFCDEHPIMVKELTTVIAERQTAGKGQRGNSWESEERKNLTFSTVFYPTFLKARQQFILSQIVSLSIKEVLDEWTGNISIKWPNDIYWKEKKICGILIENNLAGSTITRSISGIGININQETFRSNAPNPISLKQITGQEHDCMELLGHILKKIQTYYQQLRADSSESIPLITSRYTDALFRKEGFHPYIDNSGHFLARLVRVETDGRFILEDKAGKEREYLFKEVQYML